MVPLLSDRDQISLWDTDQRKLPHLQDIIQDHTQYQEVLHSSLKLEKKSANIMMTARLLDSVAPNKNVWYGRKMSWYGLKKSRRI